jgi:hypothetical protein
MLFDLHLPMFLDAQLEYANVFIVAMKMWYEVGLANENSPSLVRRRVHSRRPCRASLYPLSQTRILQIMKEQ